MGFKGREQQQEIATQIRQTRLQGETIRSQVN